LTVGAAKANEGGDTTSKRNEVEEETGVLVGMERRKGRKECKWLGTTKEEKKKKKNEVKGGEWER
jgi:hypothetical protein